MNIMIAPLLFKKPVCLIATAFLLTFFFGVASESNAQTKMYVTNFNMANVAGKHTVVRANLDGTGAEDFGNLGTTLNGPAGIALDVNAGKLYVTGWNSNEVYRANLDGTNGESLGNLGATLTNSSGIALDVPVALPTTSIPTLNE